MSSQGPILLPPPWTHCGEGASPQNQFGCTGASVYNHTECLAHLSNADRNSYLAGLAPGSDVDHRGTAFSEPLFKSLLDALRDPETSQPRIGKGRFDSATFEGIIDFESATFDDAADFNSTVFHEYASFNSVTFNSSAWFALATLRDARFDSATMRGRTSFSEATFQGDAVFSSATFEEGVSFERATFSGDA
ncbi:pentapeptide repeat-containing protein [Streptomyces sp. NPDC059698]|uniref:pentapeptide repeat-containing protein n=1 Tax=Streptomyces TaxID=1883 RepID=UPI0009A0ABFE